MGFIYSQTRDGRYSWITDHKAEGYLIEHSCKDPDARIRELEKLCSEPSDRFFAARRDSSLGQTVYIVVDPKQENMALRFFEMVNPSRE